MKKGIFTMKRFFFLSLILCIVLSLVPAAVLAEEGEVLELTTDTAAPTIPEPATSSDFDSSDEPILTLSETEYTLVDSTSFSLNAECSCGREWFSWKVSDSNILHSGISSGTACEFTGMSTGTAQITVSCYCGASASCTVNVVPGTLTLSKTSTSVKYLKYTSTITATCCCSYPSYTWRSSDKDIAEPSSSYYDSTTIRGTGIGTATITVSCSRCSGSADLAVTVKKGTVTPSVTSTKIKLENENYSYIDDEISLSASCSCGADYIRWTSSDESIAYPYYSSGSSNRIIAKDAGSATITMTCSCGAKATTKVTVTRPSISVSLNYSKRSLEVGHSKTLSATMTPSNSTDKITWKSSNTAVAKVSSTGKITGVGPGECVITAKTSSGKTAKCTVSVTLPATKVSLSASSVSLKPTKTSTLTVTLKPSNSNDKLTWKSSNKSVATVSSSGKITAIKPGSATITVTTGSGKTASCKVTVVKAPATKITLNKTSTSVNMYATKTLTATVTPSYSTDKVTWSSSDTSVAKVSSKGVVTGVNAGTATITAKTTSGKTAKCTITVKYVPKVTCKVTYCKDTSIYNDVTVSFTNNTSKEITYMELNILQYDNRGYQLASPYSYYYVNDSLAAKSTDAWVFWCNDNTKTASAYITKVWFADGTTWTP